MLLDINPDVYNELLTVDIEIAYANFPTVSNPHIYRQIDEVKFEEDSPRNLEASTKYSSFIE